MGNKFKIKRDSSPKQSLSKEERKKEMQKEKKYKEQQNSEKKKNKNVTSKKEEFKKEFNKSKTSASEYLDKVVGERKSIKQLAKEFGSRLVHFRLPNTRKQFWGSFFAITILMCMATFITAGSAGTIAVFFIYLVFVAALMCGRFTDIGLKWFIPLIILILVAISLFISMGVVAALIPETGMDSSTYSMIIETYARRIMVDQHQYANSIAWMAAAVIFSLIWLLATTVILCFKTDKFKEKGTLKFTIIYLILTLIPCALLPVGTYYTTSAANAAITETANSLYKQIYSKQDDGSYFINALFTGSVSEDSMDTVINSYNEKTKDDNWVNNYAERADYLTEYSDNLRITSLFSQNVKKGDTTVGLLELGIFNKLDTQENIYIEDVEINGTPILIKKSFVTSGRLTFIPMEVPALSDATNVTIYTTHNGETKVLKAVLKDINVGTNSSNNNTTQSNNTTSNSSNTN